VRDAQGRRPKAVSAHGQRVPWTQPGDAVQMDLTMSDIWRVIRVDWQA
jgi:hypothetical protein